MLELASVHGRFQPPHLDHLEYMLAALELAEHVIIGITQPDSQQLVDCPEDPHRSEASSNPLSFEERCEAIQLMLRQCGIEAGRFSFVRFPIEVPQNLLNLVSPKVPCFTTIRDQWNVVKIERLKSLGYEVQILWDKTGEPGRNGTAIRNKIMSGDESWKNDVHIAVVDYLTKIGIANRLR
jgi:nicotinamide mononucleotide adenylyltransferase